MSENCNTCGRKFGWLRMKYRCELCQEEFCKDCISQTTVSWAIYGNKLFPLVGEPGCELVFRNNEVRYRVMRPMDVSKRYTLCKLCNDKMIEKIEDFKVEIKNKLDSIIVTHRNHVPGYTVVKSFGFVEYRFDRPGAPLIFDPSKRFKMATDFLKSEALKLGANALINFQKTYIERLNPLSPHPKPKTTWEDFIPGYGELKYQKYQQPTYTKIPVIKAEAVVIQKIKD